MFRGNTYYYSHKKSTDGRNKISVPLFIFTAHIFPQLVPVMQQPDGVSVHYLCYKMQSLAWKKYVIARKSETGTIGKVLYADMQITAHGNIHTCINPFHLMSFLSCTNYTMLHNSNFLLCSNIYASVSIFVNFTL